MGEQGAADRRVQKIMVPTERSYHREYSCEISNMNKVISKVKVSERMTE